MTTAVARPTGSEQAVIRPFQVNVPESELSDLRQAPRRWAEKAYPKLVHFNKVAKGGHFAAWEQPELFTEELRAGCRSMRS